MAWDERTFDELAADQEIDVVVPAPDRDPIRATVWSVAVAGEVYVRSWKGEAGHWYRRARRTGSGAVVTGSGRHEVRFVPVADADLDAAIDREYLRKYARASYAAAMTRPPATGTTLRLDPAE